MSKSLSAAEAGPGPERTRPAAPLSAQRPFLSGSQPSGPGPSAPAGRTPQTRPPQGFAGAGGPPSGRAPAFPSRLHAELFAELGPRPGPRMTRVPRGGGPAVPKFTREVAVTPPCAAQLLAGGLREGPGRRVWGPSVKGLRAAHSLRSLANTGRTGRGRERGDKGQSPCSRAAPRADSEGARHHGRPARAHCPRDGPGRGRCSAGRPGPPRGSPRPRASLSFCIHCPASCWRLLTHGPGAFGGLAWGHGPCCLPRPLGT